MTADDTHAAFEATVARMHAMYDRWTALVVADRAARGHRSETDPEVWLGRIDACREMLAEHQSCMAALYEFRRGHPEAMDPAEFNRHVQAFESLGPELLAGLALSVDGARQAIRLLQP